MPLNTVSFLWLQTQAQGVWAFLGKILMGGTLVLARACMLMRLAEPWSKGYRMYTYVTVELSALVATFPFVDASRQSISGHSMGGHGALLCALKNPGKYKSVSAFAPICNASEVPWGEKTFSAYLGSNRQLWKQYDACELAKQYHGAYPHVLVHQGDKDKFLGTQLATPKFAQICKENPKLTDTHIAMCEGYDHGYYFIATFIEEHIKHHAKYLKQ